MPPTSDILSRFHQVLLREISESRPEYLTQPFTVAEIYQNLVPYQSHRDLIGVEMNGDYEDALLRLLAGEGDYLLLDSEVARREIREELEGPNPNTGLFRDFAAADVRLNPDHILTGAGEARGEDETDEKDDGDAGESGGDGVIGHIELADDGVPVPVPDTDLEHEDAPSDDPLDISSLEDTQDPVGVEPPDIPSLEDTQDPVAVEPPDIPSLEDTPDPVAVEPPDISSLEDTPDPVAVEPEEPDGPGEDVDPVAAADGGPAACHWCRQILPDRKALNFCPFCGSDPRLFPCPKCGEELEPRWQFCVSCGTEVSE